MSVQARLGKCLDLRLPKAIEQLATLRRSGFEAACEDVTGYAIERFLPPSYVNMLRDPAATADWSGDEFLPEPYCSLRSAFRATGELSLRLAPRYSRSWQSPSILSLLDSLLSDQGRRIATHVIYEIVMNSVRHPGANVLLMAAATDSYIDGQRQLIVTFWDDGESIIDTLRAAGVATGYLSPRQSAMCARDIDVTVSTLNLSGDNSDVGRTYSISNQERVANDSTDELILLASLFPGTSRDIDSPAGFRPYSAEETLEMSLLGMGLYIMSTAVTERFGGVVTLRTSNVSLSLTAGDGDKRLTASAEIIGDGDVNAQMLGNQITVHIPIS